MSKLLLIKLGGSLITDKSKNATAKPSVILRLAKEIKAAIKVSADQIIIAHGSGSFGHIVAAKYHVKDGLTDDVSRIGLPLVADAAVQINRIVIKAFLHANLPSVSFSPASFIIADDREPLKIMAEPIFLALEKGFLPILYGDIIFDRTRGFCIFSSETIISLLSQKASAQYDEIKIIFCGNTDGVYDAEGKTIPLITPTSFPQLSRLITGSNQIDVTGGMLHKVEQSLALSEKGISTLIINGNRVGELTNAITGRTTHGTTITG